MAVILYIRHTVNGVWYLDFFSFFCWGNVSGFCLSGMRHASARANVKLKQEIKNYVEFFFKCTTLYTKYAIKTVL